MEELLNIVENFKNQKILIVGDLMLDEYVSGDITRVSPEAPIPILEVKEKTYVPGGAANTAHNIKALGGEVVLAGVLGQDENGRILKETLEKEGFVLDGIFVDPKRKTTLKSRIVAKHQQVIRVDSEDKHWIDSELEGKIFELVKSRIGEVYSIVLSDYAKGVLTARLAEKIIEISRENNVLCLVDSKSDNYLKYRNCNIITPNEKELARSLNMHIINDSQFLEAGKKLLSDLACDCVLVKQGEKGMSVFEKKGEVFHFPAINKKAIDVSGAGDTSIAVFALSLNNGVTLRQAAVIASHACSIAVGKRRTAVVFKEELEESLKNNSIELGEQA